MTQEENIQTVIDFLKTVVQNTKDIDVEFVDIVNDNFWELMSRHTVTFDDRDSTSLRDVEYIIKQH
jgi:hypothetical protein